MTTSARCTAHRSTRNRTTTSEQPTNALDRGRRAAGRGGVVVEQSLVRGDPRTAIPDLVNDIGAELVVLGARGEGGFKGLPLGGSLATCSITSTSRSRSCHRTGGDLEGGVVVVGVDGSDANRSAVQWAVAAAASIKGSVDAVFVHDPLADSYGHGNSTNWKYRGQEQAERTLRLARANPPRTRSRDVRQPRRSPGRDRRRDRHGTRTRR